MATLRADSQAAADAQTAAAKAYVPPVSVPSLSSLGVNPTVKSTATPAPTSTIPSFTPTTAITGGPNLSSEVPAGTISSGAYGPAPTPTPTPTQTPLPPPGGGDPNAISLDRQDAFASLKLLFESYGLGDLSTTIEQLMKDGETSQGALVKLKYDPKYNQAYTARFAGNTIRVANGLNAISEAQYIINENAYAETLKAYGLTNMLSTDRKVNEKQFATYIGNDLSSTEFTSRIKTAEDSVVNADPEIMNTFKQFYGTLTTSDLISYFLAPDETLPKLQEKAMTAQIGTAAKEAGFSADQTRATQLAKMGVTQAGAIQGYATIADLLPAASKLSDIYKGQTGDGTFNLQSAEQEQFNLAGGTEVAAARKRMKSLERAQFSGDAGLTASQGYGLANSIQGKF